MGQLLAEDVTEGAGVHWQPDIVEAGEPVDDGECLLVGAAFHVATGAHLRIGRSARVGAIGRSARVCAIGRSARVGSPRCGRRRAAEVVIKGLPEQSRGIPPCPGGVDLVNPPRGVGDESGQCPGVRRALQRPGLTLCGGDLLGAGREAVELRRPLPGRAPGHSSFGGLPLPGSGGQPGTAVADRGVTQPVENCDARPLAARQPQQPQQCPARHRATERTLPWCVVGQFRR